MENPKGKKSSLIVRITESKDYNAEEY